MIRVLDLGAHDGAIPSWLAGQYPDARFDGVEPNPRAVAVYNRRLRGRGECKRGLAEDAPALFEPGSYDAVSLFEVLEHTSDMDRLLSATERMVKPGGRVYVSTPDGTFGAGSNPNHLRALRAVDLADLLRRRGHLTDMAVGSDGIAVASYTPGERREDVAIYTGPSWMPWKPTDILTHGLGGSETAAVRLAQALSELGYVVTVYGDTGESMALRDVIYRPHHTFEPMERRGALISSRMPELFDRRINAGSTLLWLHDTDCGDRLTPRRARGIDHILTLSEWHEAHVRGCYPFAAGKVVRARNGIAHPLFQGEAGKRRKRVLYTSSPDRGLDVLLELWPRVLERVPDAELNYCYTQVYDRVADLSGGPVQDHRAKVRELADQPGVKALGALSQPALARLMRESMVWAHPSWASVMDTAFHETSCIGAAEAQAAGCVVVASAWGALPETVRVGRLVNGGTVHDDRWRDAFVNEIVDGLTNEATQEWAQTEGPRAMADWGWDGVAEQVSGLIAQDARRKAA